MKPSPLAVTCALVGGALLGLLSGRERAETRTIEARTSPAEAAGPAPGAFPVKAPAETSPAAAMPAAALADGP